MARLSRWLAIALSLYGLWWVVGIVEPFTYRSSFLAVALLLIHAGGATRSEDAPIADPSRTRWWDAASWMAATVVAFAWPLAQPDAFTARAATPSLIDVVVGLAIVALVLDATRRTSGAFLPAIALLFLGYGYFGPLLELVGLGTIAHRGYTVERLVGVQTMTLEGVFGVPLDVASTYLVLFTIFGAVLEKSGAGRFFVDWSLAAIGRGRGAAAPARAVVGAGLLLGTVAGSGVATTVTLGSCAWPLLRGAGYSPVMGAAVFAASGIGAIIAPPALGAAAFLIAEFAGVPYARVALMALLPALIYFAAVLAMVEIDARRADLPPAVLPTASLGALTRRYGHFFLAPAAIVALLAIGTSAFRAVSIATLVAIALSFVRAETAMRPRRLLDALEAGGRAIVPIVATTATAGIIVGVVTLTGLGLELAGMIVALAGGSLLLTVLFGAAAVWLLGLAVPVTASYILAAVTVVPALAQAGVPLLAAHMFVFYYAALSEVTPPTALAPFAAAALTGANPHRATMLTWKYTMPAFVVPIVFTTSSWGGGLLLIGSRASIAAAMAGTGALVVAVWWWSTRVSAGRAPARSGSG